jgi:hypothetical protein
MGSVTLLTGQPKEGVFVEARSESTGYYEEATTDSFGRFRLRGLVPGSTYSIRVAAKDNLQFAAVERASPDYLSVDVSLNIFFFEVQYCLQCHILSYR